VCEAFWAEPGAWREVIFALYEFLLQGAKNPAMGELTQQADLWLMRHVTPWRATILVVDDEVEGLASNQRRGPSHRTRSRSLETR
jgi:hypothetical protein